MRRTGKPFFLSGTLVSIGSVVSFPRGRVTVWSEIFLTRKVTFATKKSRNRVFAGFSDCYPEFELGTSSLPTDWKGEVCCFPGLLCPLLSETPCYPALFLSVDSVHSFPRVGHGVESKSLISSRNSGSTSKMMAQITIQLVSS